MEIKQKRNLVSIIGAQIFCILLILTWMFYEPLDNNYDWLMFFGPSIFLIILGIILTFLVKKFKIVGKVRVFLLMAGISTIYFFPATVAHNFLSVWGEDLGGMFGGILGFLGAFFFITSIICVPLLLFIGIVGSLFLLLRKM